MAMIIFGKHDVISEVILLRKIQIWLQNLPSRQKFEINEIKSSKKRLFGHLWA